MNMAASLSAEKWKTFFDTDGRLVDELGLRKTIFSCKWYLLVVLLCVRH